MPYVVMSECILCGVCVAGCESNAITEGVTQSHIDPAICIECGLCKQNCPSDAIIFIEEGKAAPLPAAGTSQEAPHQESGL